jgi:hypothetical protein
MPRMEPELSRCTSGNRDDDGGDRDFPLVTQMSLPVSHSTAQ